jgi:hypothetical protein
MASAPAVSEPDENSSWPFHQSDDDAVGEHDLQRPLPWYLIDADGNDIEPSAEGSALMEAYFTAQQTEEFHDVQSLHLDCNPETTVERQHESCGGMVGVSAAALGRLHEITDGNVAMNARSADHSRRCNVSIPGDDEGDDAGMSIPMFSREYSNGSADDEWILECILRRRVLRSPAASYHHRKQFDDDSGCEVVAETHTMYEYLCKWKWYSEPTWESRVVLEDLGLVSQLNAFDAMLRLGNSNTSESTTDSLPRRVRAGDVQHILGVSSIMASIKQQFCAANKKCSSRNQLVFLRYAEVLNRELEERFLHRWRAGLGHITPTVLFHGTRLVNIPSICKTGFKIAGRSGVKIQNGAAFGRGVYTAPTPRMAASFASSDLMFVCLGLVPSHAHEPHESSESQFLRMVVTDRGSMIIFHDEALVMPLFVIQFMTTGGLRQQTSDEASIVQGTCEPQLVPLTPLINGVYGSVDRWQTDPYRTQYSRPNAAVAAKDTIVDGSGPTKVFTKKMIKQLPRSIKDAYRLGSLRPRKTSS